MRPWAGFALVALVVSLAASGCADPAAAPPGGTRPAPVTVRVAAASDLKFALDEIAATLPTASPPVRLSVSYGSSGTLYQQLLNGAPFDMYLSADLSYPEKLVTAGQGQSSDVFEYAVGRLVVWAPTGSPVDPTSGLSALTDPAAAKVAIANPEHAPYGVAAVAAMRAAGVYDQVRPKLVLGENVAQAAEFVQSGNAQVGVIALSLALSPQLSGAGRWSEVPLTSFPRLRQGGLVLTRATDPRAARQVRDALLSPAGRAVLARYGFSEPSQ